MVGEGDVSGKGGVCGKGWGYVAKLAVHGKGWHLSQGGGGHAWHRAYMYAGETATERVVRILLECILVV